MGPSLDDSQPAARSKGRGTVVLLGVAAAGLLYLLWLIWNGDVITSLKEGTGPLRYFTAMTILPALGLPLTPFFVVAGATFGTHIGLIGSAIALGLNLSLCYWIAHTGLRPRLLSLFERFDYKLPNFQDRKGGRLRFVALVKMTPGLPGFAKNYVLGVAGVPFWLFFGASMVFTGVYAIALVWLGESLALHDVSDGLLAAAGVVLLGVGVWWWRRRRARAA